MMSDKVKLDVATRESVALQMAENIASKESMWQNSRNYRKDFLTLYVQCFEAAGGNLPDELQ